MFARISSTIVSSSPRTLKLACSPGGAGLSKPPASTNSAPLIESGQRPERAPRDRSGSATQGPRDCHRSHLSPRLRPRTAPWSPVRQRLPSGDGMCAAYFESGSWQAATGFSTGDVAVADRRVVFELLEQAPDNVRQYRCRQCLVAPFTRVSRPSVAMWLVSLGPSTGATRGRTTLRVWRTSVTGSRSVKVVAL